MKPTDILENEHRLIEKVVDSLERITEQGEREGCLDEESIGLAIDFLRNFADAFHHAKEESYFFPAMEAKGFPRDGGPTGVMLHEHELGRHRVKRMSEELEAFQAGDSTAVPRFAEHSRAIVALLRNHVDKEDQCLFNMANSALTAAQQEELLSAFEETEAEYIRTRSRDYAQVAEDLARRFQVSPRDHRNAENHRCCGH